MSGKTPTRTFYRRDLPSSCTAFSSDEGRALFASAMIGGGTKTFFRLVEQFSTQAEPAYCGPSTLVVVLNALSVDPRRAWKGPWRWYEESMLNCCIDMEAVKKKGITFATFVCLARCQGLTVEARRAEESTVEEFRRAVRASCVSSEGGQSSDDSTVNPLLLLVTSYSRRVFDQTGDGHFSPIAAYDEASDKVLILDTARFKYGPHWVPLQLLFDAMVPVDMDTGKSRGYFLLSFEGDDMSSTALPLQSILFRSKKSHDPVRRQFRKFMENRDTVSFDEVTNFWTKGGSDAKFVFDMIEPQLYPVDKSEARLVEDMMLLVKSLVENISCLGAADDKSLTQCCGDRCGPNAFRKVPVTAIQAIFIVYLATLPPELRRQIVYSGEQEEESNGVSAGVSNQVRDQLIQEAELVQYAIEMSSSEEQQ